MRLAPGNNTLSLGLLSEILSCFPTSPASHWPGCFVFAGPSAHKPFEEGLWEQGKKG